MYLTHIMLLNLHYGIFSTYFDNTLISAPVISICTFIHICLFDNKKYCQLYLQANTD